MVEELADERVGGESRVVFGRGLLFGERAVLEASPAAEEAEEVAFREVDPSAVWFAMVGEVWVVCRDVLVPEALGTAAFAERVSWLTDIVVGVSPTEVGTDFIR